MEFVSKTVKLSRFHGFQEGYRMSIILVRLYGKLIKYNTVNLMITSTVKEEMPSHSLLSTSKWERKYPMLSTFPKNTKFGKK